MKSKILTSILAVSALLVTAQNLSTEIEVERTILVPETQASPLSSALPRIAPSPLEQRSLNLTEYTLEGIAEARTDSLEAGNATSVPGMWPWRGYVSAGYLPMFNIGLDAGYRLVASESTRVDAVARYGGFSHTGAINAAGDKTKATCNTLSLGLDASHLIGGTTLKATAAYDHMSLASPMLNLQKLDRGFNSAKISLAADGFNTVRWYAGIDARYSSSTEALVPESAAPSSTSGALRAGASYMLGTNLAVSLDARWQMMHRGGMQWSVDPQGVAWLTEIFHTSRMLLSLTPALTYKSGLFTAKAGVRADISDGHDIAKFAVAPDVMFTVRSGIFMLYGTARGGIEMYDLAYNIKSTPFLAGSNTLSPSRSTIDAHLGVRVGGARGPAALLEGGYANIEQSPVIATVLQKGNEYQAIMQADRKGFGFRIRLEYNATFAGLSAFAQGEFTPECDKRRNPWNMYSSKAAYSAGISAQPIDKLKLNLKWQYRTGRQAYSWKPALGEVATSDLGDANNLSLDAAYRLTRTISLGVNLENLLCRRWLLIPGVYSPRINGLVYASMKF